MIKAAPWIALTVIGLAFAVAHIAVSFIESGPSVYISNPLQIKIGVEHPPAPTVHIHKKGVWGV